MRDGCRHRVQICRKVAGDGAPASPTIPHTPTPSRRPGTVTSRRAAETTAPVCGTNRAICRPEPFAGHRSGSSGSSRDLAPGAPSSFSSLGPRRRSRAASSTRSPTSGRTRTTSSLGSRAVGVPRQLLVGATGQLVVAVAPATPDDGPRHRPRSLTTARRRRATRDADDPWPPDVPSRSRPNTMSGVISRRRPDS